jgi:hypothetical protein
LVETFLTEVDHESIVMGYKEPYGRPLYAIGGRVKGDKDGYMRITGNVLLSSVTLKISRWRSGNKEADRRGAF